MPPKTKKMTAPKGSNVSVARPRKALTPALIRQTIKSVGEAHSRNSALQLLDAQKAYLEGSFVDAPSDDSSPVHCWGTVTSLITKGYTITTGGSTALRVIVDPRPQGHLQYATAYDASGVPTTWSNLNVENYSALPSYVDDLRCVSMMLVVKTAGANDTEAGLCHVCNMNPQPTAASCTLSFALSEPGLKYPATKVHYCRVPWFPARPEVDHAFVGPTSVTVTEATALMFNYTCVEASPTETFSIDVYAIWAGRLLANSEFVSRSKIYTIDSAIYENELETQLMLSPLYSQGRIMCKDDGPIQVISGIVDSGKKVISAGKQVYEGVVSGIDAVSSLASRVGSVFSSFASLFGDREIVLRRLHGLTPEQLALASRLASRLTPEQIGMQIDYERFQRRNPPRPPAPVDLLLEDEQKTEEVVSSAPSSGEGRSKATPPSRMDAVRPIPSTFTRIN